MFGKQYYAIVRTVLTADDKTPEGIYTSYTSDIKTITTFIIADVINS